MNEQRTKWCRGGRRAAILDVAREVFSEDGYAAASMSHIAARLGGSKGTLYNYFKSKEELFEAHVQDQCSCKVAEAFAPPLVGDDVVAVLAGLGERLLGAILTDESTAFYSLIVSEAQRNPFVGRAFYESGPKNGIGRIADFLGRAHANGHLVIDDYVRAAEEFLSLLHGGFHWKRVLNVIPTPSPQDIHAHALRAAQVFVRAYEPRN